MIFFQNNLVPLFLLGSLVPFAMVEGKQHLRRRAQQQCIPNLASINRHLDSFTFVLLEFEKTAQSFLNINTNIGPDINGTLFADVYNSLVSCSQTGAVRSIDDVEEFRPLAVYVNNTDDTNPTMLLQVNNFFCNSCGSDDNW